MTSASRTSRRSSSFLGLALGAALAAGVVAPAAASAAPAAINVAPVVAHTVHRTTAAHTPTARHAAKPRPTKPAVKAASITRVSQSVDEARMLVLLNAQRVAHHLVPLVEAAGPTDVARRWSMQLKQDGGLSHNPNLVGQLQSAGGGNWRWLAENVGVAPAGETDQLFAAYMASPHHRANILDPRARYIGLGTVTDSSGTSWNTMDFTDSYSNSYGAPRTLPAA